MLAYSYLRFSTTEQSKGDSLRRQLEKSEQYAVEKGLTLDTSFNLRDLGLSAFDKSNVTKGQLGAFIRAVEQGRVLKGSYLLVEHLDRLSRAQVLDALEQFIAILNAGIIIVTLNDNQIYSRDSVASNPMALMMSIALMAAAHDESDKKSKRLQAAWLSKRNKLKSEGKILTKHTPYWIEVVNDKLQLIPERAEVVRRVFEMAKEGIGTLTIIKQLNASVPAWSRSGSWTASYIHHIVDNPAAYGSITLLGGEVIDNYYPPVVSKEDWEYVSLFRASRAPSKRAGSKKGKTISNLFSGLMHCGYCGSKSYMNGFVERRRKEVKRTNVFYCNGAKISAKTCRCIGWDYEQFEGLFLFKVANIDFLKTLGGDNSQDFNQLEQVVISAQHKVTDIDKRLANVYKAIEEEGTSGLAKIAAKLEREREEFADALKRAENDLNVARMSSSVAKDRMGLMLKMFNAQKTADEDTLRLIRETLSEQIKAIVQKIELFPAGPTLNSNDRDMRYAIVHFQNKSTITLSEG